MRPARIVMQTRGQPPVTGPVLRGGKTGKGKHLAYPDPVDPYGDTTLDEQIAQLVEMADELGYEVVPPVISRG